jgi:hypothetical protein
LNRIAPSAAMLLDETGSAAGILAWHRRTNDFDAHGVDVCY